MTWQPIETAPKVPFKNVLLWDGEEVSISSFFPEEGWVQTITFDAVYPTQWMPLPEPPPEEEAL